MDAPSLPSHFSIHDKKLVHSHQGVYAAITRETEAGPEMLVIKKARGPFHGLYDLPGGRKEAGESEQQALRREIKEETGLDTTHIGDPLIHYSMLDYYAGSKLPEHPLLEDYRKEPVQHRQNTHIYEVAAEGELKTTPDGLDSNGAEWVNAKWALANAHLCRTSVVEAARHTLNIEKSIKDLLIVTGPSGAGETTLVKTLSDKGLGAKDLYS